MKENKVDELEWAEEMVYPSGTDDGECGECDGFGCEDCDGTGEESYFRTQ